MSFTIVTDSDIKAVNADRQVKVQDVVLRNGASFQDRDGALIPFNDDVLLNIDEANICRYAKIIEAFSPLGRYHFSASNHFVDSLIFASIEAIHGFILSNNQSWDCQGFIIHRSYENLEFVLKTIFTTQSTVTIIEHKEDSTPAFIFMGKTTSLVELTEQQLAICQRLVAESKNLVAVVWLSESKIYRLNTANPFSEAERLGFELNFIG